MKAVGFHFDDFCERRQVLVDDIVAHNKLQPILLQPQLNDPPIRTALALALEVADEDVRVKHHRHSLFSRDHRLPFQGVSAAIDGSVLPCPGYGIWLAEHRDGNQQVVVRP